MTLLSVILYSFGMFLLGMIGGAVIAKLDKQDAERERRDVRCWNWKVGE